MGNHLWSPFDRESRNSFQKIAFLKSSFEPAFGQVNIKPLSDPIRRECNDLMLADGGNVGTLAEASAARISPAFLLNKRTNSRAMHHF
jgi:hypothetical protein